MRPRPIVPFAALAALLVAGCTMAESGPAAAPTSSPTTLSASPTTTPTVIVPSLPATAEAVISEVPDEQWRRIVATGVWRPECPVGQADLRRLEVNHVDFAGELRRGVLVAHRDSVDDLAEIFEALYQERFPITRMVPAEEYGGDVAASLAADSTSAFNCRRPDQINAPFRSSPHANGRAIDINPYRNPWLDLRCDCWQPSADFATVRTGPGVISEGSLPWRLFTERGWIWQNIKVPDYMHFDTGYPSRPRVTPAPTASG